MFYLSSLAIGLSRIKRLLLTQRAFKESGIGWLSFLFRFRFLVDLS
jgi:hypothetical protein